MSIEIFWRNVDLRNLSTSVLMNFVCIFPIKRSPFHLNDSFPLNVALDDDMLLQNKIRSAFNYEVFLELFTFELTFVYFCSFYFT